MAIKILPLPDEFAEIQREIDILHKCRNANIVEYYGCYHDRENETFWVLTIFRFLPDFLKCAFDFVFNFPPKT